MSKTGITKKSEIKISVGLDEENVPIKMEWQAQDDPKNDNPKECKAMLLSLFDKESLDT